VAARIRRAIVKGELVEGTELPPEAVLLPEFGVSRPTLREAFRLLEAEGLITILRGARGGSIVRRPDEDVAARYAALCLEYQGATLADVFEASVGIDAQAAWILASRPNKDKVTSQLRECAREAEAPGSERAELRAHAAFHRLVVELTENQTLILLSRLVGRVLDLAIAENLAPSRRTGALRAGLQGSQLEHYGLIDLIQAERPEEAMAAWHRHISGIAQRISRGAAGKTVLDLLD
jgi:DNA-binding FadR family transcriptional regulator